MKILCYCAMAPKRPRLFARTIAAALNVNWGIAVDFVFGREDVPAEGKYANIAKKYNQARKLALGGGYDALFLFEFDNIIPENAMQRLSRVNADVVYGLYCSRRNGHKWLAFQSISETRGVSYSDYLSIDQRVDAFGSVIDCEGVGHGCTLINRRALEKLKFRVPENNRGQAPDWYFSLDAKKKGLTQKADLGVVVGHIAPEKGVIIWPDPVTVYRLEPVLEKRNIPNDLLFS